MGIEIERKFLVVPLGPEDKVPAGHWRTGKQLRITQGYLAQSDRSVVRIRRTEQRGRAPAAWITVKGATLGATRAEYEYAIDPEDAQEMLDTLCDPVIDKTRFVLSVEGHVWEVDEFAADNAGLVVAEVELDSESEAFVEPYWVDTEVTGDARYYNSNLVLLPYCRWS